MPERSDPVPEYPELPLRFPFMGTWVSQVSETELVSLILEAADTTIAPPLTVSYLNPHAVNLARRDRAFRDALASMDVIYCDGFGVKWCAEWAGLPTLPRITGPDWTALLLERLNGTTHRLFFLGDRPEVVSEAVQAVCHKYPDIQIAGSHHGFFHSHPEQERVRQAIAASGADIVWLGMGMPRQEAWVQAMRDRLPGVRAMLCLGAIFGHLSGTAYRAPRWATDRGLEWLTRLLHNPRVYFMRYVTGNNAYLAHYVRWRYRRPGAKRDR